MSAFALLRRFTATVCLAFSATLIGLCLVQPSPAAAAGGGYVRLAHLVPDAIACDMYLQLHSVTGDVVKYLPSVKYGTISEYVMVPSGTYAVAMRAPGDAPGSKPVLSTSLTVADGHAYTVGRMGSPSNAIARIIEDDRTLPDGGQAKLRVVQAAQRTLDVTLAGGPVIANAIAFTTATDYQGIAPGAKTLRVQPAGGEPISVRATMTAGSIYSLLVLQAADGNVTATVLSDAKRSGAVPSGGVATGAGGTAKLDASGTSAMTAVLLLGLVAVVMVGSAVVASRVVAPRAAATRRERGLPSMLHRGEGHRR